ncbi:KH domain-containing protein akap-1 [Diachasmimorpha longicaudata]|uniref:KH domain-containing protein akap-1 n=1 Tax=Diachasmimorpha longicaudata TaxID=58733 RepID=UPI0030B868FE
MGIRNVQLIKWAVPFALIIGLFWYKRRRVDRVDPGGNSKIEQDPKNFPKSPSNVANTNLSGSRINIGDSPSNKEGTTEGSGIGLSPRRVSRSLDIPARKTKTQGIGMEPSQSESSSWYTEVEQVPEMKEVVLGSNPTFSSFDMMSRSTNHVEITQEPGEEVTFDSAPKEEEPKISMDSNNTNGQALSERDSANHSPVSGVLDGSVNDDVRSEGSTDSGKGGSINGQSIKQKVITTYEFTIPESLAGRMIGKRGIAIQELNTKAEVTMTVKPHPTTKDLKLCLIEGTEENINIALDLIRERFPLKKFPEVTLDQVNVSYDPNHISWLAHVIQIHLVAGVNNDVRICHILQPDKMFIQMPTHPSHPSLKLLDYNMTQLYNTTESPPVPDQLAPGMIVVVKWFGTWARAIVEEADPAGKRHSVRLVDHGGYWTFSSAAMRKIRSDYLMLPFQAMEVYLANVKPKNGKWGKEAFDILKELSAGTILQAQVEGYIDSSVYVSLYINIPKHGLISIADEFIARDLADSSTFEEMLREQSLPHYAYTSATKKTDDTNV